jgi:hypothetical protein
VDLPVLSDQGVDPGMHGVRIGARRLIGDSLDIRFRFRRRPSSAGKVSHDRFPGISLDTGGI